jgi:hypothetical protein
VLVPDVVEASASSSGTPLAGVNFEGGLPGFQWNPAGTAIAFWSSDQSFASACSPAFENLFIKDLATGVLRVICSGVVGTHIGTLTAGV